MALRQKDVGSDKLLGPTRMDSANKPLKSAKRSDIIFTSSTCRGLRHDSFGQHFFATFKCNVCFPTCKTSPTSPLNARPSYPDRFYRATHPTSKPIILSLSMRLIIRLGE